MTRRACKQTTTLLLALCLLVTSAFAACMVCDTASIGSEFKFEASCAQVSFESDCGSDDCCEKNNGCADQSPDVKAFARRNVTEEAQGLAVVAAASAGFVPQHRLDTVTTVDYQSSAPPDRRYIQHCSFLC